tara:strand:+ start:393 stop:2321 length:1929 start_codon:yes stop_codon:yes gene_type:complete
MLMKCFGPARRGIAASMLLAGAALLSSTQLAAAMALEETPLFAERVAAGELPPIRQRVPMQPSVAHFSGERSIGQQGGELRTLIGRAKDVRLLVVYGYARLVAYNEDFELEPDILESYEIEDGRSFTLHLRKGHKWSDGTPFTVEDIRYWWEDIANNAKLSPAGPPREMLIDGKPPVFDVLDDTTVRFTWHRENPFFLPRLAGASPLFIYRPSHYLKQFHAKYADPVMLKQVLRKRRIRNWASYHNRLDNMYRFDNPELPTLQPWINTTRPPAQRFVAERNPYYHRIDEAGRQLPYIDKIILNVSDGKLIPAKAGTGEVDLQARNLAFSNITFLRENEDQNGFTTLLWRIAKGSHVALFPNLNVKDPAWQALLRDVRFRRALSLGIDRTIINESLYFGMALEGNNTVLPESPLFEDAYQTAWAEYDPRAANRLLDECGLTERNSDGIRLMADGRPLEIIIETAGEDAEQVDVLELVRETWAEIGVKLFVKPSQREVLRRRIFAGETLMSVWTGLENGVPSATTSPQELAPTSQQQLMWPAWGQYHETSGMAGQAPELPLVEELYDLNKQWTMASTLEERQQIWQRMLSIHAEQVYSIGIISGVLQPIVIRKGLRNVPEEGVFNWDPGAQFGVYRPDSFWFEQ